MLTGDLGERNARGQSRALLCCTALDRVRAAHMAHQRSLAKSMADSHSSQAVQPPR